MKIVICVLFLLTLSACGGGGGSDEGSDLSSSGSNSESHSETDEERSENEFGLSDESNDEDSEFEESDEVNSLGPKPVSDVLRNCGSPAQPLKIMPFGDSITEGQRGHNTYRRSLWFQLHESGCFIDYVGNRLGVSNGSRNTGGQRPPNPDFDLDHEGRWDYRADELVGTAANAVAEHAPDVILIHIGTNDLMRGQSVTSTLADIAAIIDSVRLAKPDIAILVAQLVPASDVRSKIIELNSLIPGLVATRFDRRSPLIVVDQFTGYFSEDNYDGIHPAKSGEGKIASNWTNAILGLVADQ